MNNCKHNILIGLFYLILTAIAIELGYIGYVVFTIRENNIKRDVGIIGAISSTMRQEFEYDRQTYKFIIEE